MLFLLRCRNGFVASPIQIGDERSHGAPCSLTATFIACRELPPLPTWPSRCQRGRATSKIPSGHQAHRSQLQCASE
jgi:hypothetical protein